MEYVNRFGGITARISLLVVAILCVTTASADFSGLVPNPPRLSAKSFVLFDVSSGTVLAENNAHEAMEPASLTKIMTVYVVANALKEGAITLDQQTVISEKAWKMEGSRMFIEVNKSVGIDALLDGIIVQSGNDASVAIAEFVSGGEDVFANEMTAAAQRLGMQNSSFANSTGLPDPNTYVTAYDLALLSSALIREHPEIYQRFAIREFTYNDIRQFNRNRLLARDNSVDGIKTGHTEAAGYCLVASATRDGMRLVSVVMGTESDEIRTEESQKLLNYGFRFFESRAVYKPGDEVASIKVWKGEVDSLALTVPHQLNIVVPRGKFDEVEASAEVPGSITAPVEHGQALGSMVLRLGERELANIALVAASAADEASFFGRMVDDVKMRFE